MANNNYKYNLDYQVGRIIQKLENITSQENINKALAKSADAVYAEVVKNVPIHNEDLLNGLKITDPHDNKIEVYDDAYHAPFIEFGTGIYASDGNGRQDGWWYPATEDMVIKYCHLNKAGDGFKDAYYWNGQWWIFTRGYDPDKKRPRGGHFMERGGQTAEPKVKEIFKETLMEGK